MKTIAVRMPQMGQSAAEGTIVKWHKQTGDVIRADELLVEVESDKINFEVESPATGRLIGCIKEGRTVPVGDTIAMIEAEGSVEPITPPAPTAIDGARPHHGQHGDQELVSTAAMPSALEAPEMPEATRDWLSPSVMRLALLNNITADELRVINGTGRHGRVTREDVLKLAGRRSSGSPAVIAHPEPRVLGADSVVPMTSIRKTIADHMVQSIRTSAHVTMVHTVDVTHIVGLRNQIKDAFFQKHGVRMSYTAVFTYAVARVLREFPTINASVMGTNIVVRSEINVGCAVALPDESLVVPVVRHADKKSFPEISSELDRLIELARTKSLTPQDVHGGTFTISNFGAFGSLIGTPLINQPQVAILGMGAIYRAPVVVNDAICIRDITYLSFSFDHRVIDGAMGGRFLNRLQKTIEALTEAELNVAELL